MSEMCENNIIITGEKENVDKLKSIIDNLMKNRPSSEQNRNTFFYDLIGLPDDTENYEQNWSEINKKVFGTKQDVDIDFVLFTTYEDTIEMILETAWTPPISFIKTLCKKYNVNSQMTYFEFTDDFSGFYEFFSDGTEVSEEYSYLEGLYKFKNDYFWDEVDFKIPDLVDLVMESSEEENYANEETILSVVSNEFGFVDEQDYNMIVESLIESIFNLGYEISE